MIPKKLHEIQLVDIEQLLQNSVPEGKTIEYKEALPADTDLDKKEFLADVSSFANTIGGDLIFGIKEDKGTPQAITGISLTDLDKEISRLENIIRDGIEPRIQHEIFVLPPQNNVYLIIIRVKQSWTKPHRVIFKNHDKFYARNSNGKYPLDVTELRQLFNLSDTITKKIQDFRINRIMEIENGIAPMPLKDGNGKIILHLIPFESFGTNTEITIDELLKLRTDTDNFRPMATNGWSYKVNLDGVLAYCGGLEKGWTSYLQIYRNGVIEALEDLYIGSKKERQKLPSYSIEEECLETLGRCLKLLQKLNINTPIYVFLTLTGVGGFEMAYDMGRYHFDSNPIEKDILYLPEGVVQDYGQELSEVLRPVFDLIWNACGIPRSINFDKDGNWIQR